MKHFILVSVFLLGLVLRVSTAAGADTVFVPAPSSNSNSNSNSSNSNSNANAANANTSVVVPGTTTVHASPTVINEVANEEESDRRDKVTHVNNITVSPSNSLAYNQRINDDVTTVLGVRSDRSYGPSVALIPLAGATYFTGQWYQQVSNQYTFGLALEIPVAYYLSVEAEGSYGRYNLSTITMYGPMFTQFQQYNIGGNLKIYLSKGLLRPFVGAGGLGTYYQGLNTYNYNPYDSSDQWVGSGQAFAGADIALSENLAVGARGAYILPLFKAQQSYQYNQPVVNNLVNASQWRILGSVRVAF